MRHFNICLVVVFSVFVLTLQSAAQNKVVVIPLGGTEPTGDVQPENVLEGTTFSSSSGTGLTGTMPNLGAVDYTPGTTDWAVGAGYHNGSGFVRGDVDLVSANIKSGVNIFGVSGDSNVVDTSSGDAVAQDIMAGKKAWVDGSEVTGVGDSDLVASNIRCGVTIFGVTGTLSPGCVAGTGQSACYDSGGTLIDCSDTGQDGDYQMGCDPAVSPVGGFSFGNYKRTSIPCSAARWSDNGDGTVTDGLTGLVWLRDANCFARLNWPEALSAANGLATGSCGLSDGSSAGDWRLPNINELRSLFDPGLSAPYLPAGHPFTGVQSYHYWSGTTFVDLPNLAWLVYLVNGSAGVSPKVSGFYVWPVRGGQ